MVIRIEQHKANKFLSLDSDDVVRFSSAAKWRDEIVGDISVVAWPMNRFYNHGDPTAANIDWNDNRLRVYEKLDGTMCVLYWDHVCDRWHVATRSVPEADVPINKGNIVVGDITFSELFFIALHKTLLEYSTTSCSASVQCDSNVNRFVVNQSPEVSLFLSTLNKGITYVFELTSPHNHVVVKYEEPRVTLLAARRLSDVS